MSSQGTLGVRARARLAQVEKTRVEGHAGHVHTLVAHHARGQQAVQSAGDQSQGLGMRHQGTTLSVCCTSAGNRGENARSRPRVISRVPGFRA